MNIMYVHARRHGYIVVFRVVLCPPTSCNITLYCNIVVKVYNKTWNHSRAYTAYDTLRRINFASARAEFFLMGREDREWKNRYTGTLAPSLSCFKENGIKHGKCILSYYNYYNMYVMRILQQNRTPDSSSFFITLS